jgi:hypothetical protein
MVRREGANVCITHNRLVLGVYFVSFVDTKQISQLVTTCNKELRRKVVPKGGLERLISLSQLAGKFQKCSVSFRSFILHTVPFS